MSHTYIFLGDSITEANRFWLPETNGLGNGYVSFIHQSLSQSISDLHSINRGIDGFTVPAILTSLNNSPLPSLADFISLLIGINDVGVSMNTGVSLEDLNFAENYSALLNKLKSAHSRILCMGPFIFPHPQKYELWIPSVRKAEGIMSDIASDFGIPFIKLHDYMNSQISNHDYDAITIDGFHLTETGSRLLADYLLPHYQLSPSTIHH